MKLKCINQGSFKNITLGNEYQLLEESVDLYIIINNIGVSARYSKDYFEVIPEPIPEIIEDVDEVGVVEVEEEDTIIVNYVNSGGISILINGNETKLNYYGVAGNCGIYSFNGINDLFDFCHNDKELFQKAILEIIKVFAESKNGCMLIFSTNDEMYEIWEVLDEVMDTQSEAINNPNSDMDIKLWVKYTYYDKNDEDEDEY